MNDLKFSRRALLLSAIPAAATFTVFEVCAAQTKVASCVNPEDLTDSQVSLGESLRYTDQSADVTKTCNGCAYFHAGNPPGCGQCDILNRPVSTAGHCVSWSKKA